MSNKVWILVMMCVLCACGSPSNANHDGDNEDGNLTMANDTTAVDDTASVVDSGVMANDDSRMMMDNGTTNSGDSETVALDVQATSDVGTSVSQDSGSMMTDSGHSVDGGRNMDASTSGNDSGSTNHDSGTVDSGNHNHDSGQNDSGRSDSSCMETDGTQNIDNSCLCDVDCKRGLICVVQSANPMALAHTCRLPCNPGDPTNGCQPDEMCSPVNSHQTICVFCLH